MSVALYMDVHVRRAVTNGLRMRGVDVITAREDGTAMWPDDRLLPQVSYDEAVGLEFAGIRF